MIWVNMKPPILDKNLTNVTIVVNLLVEKTSLGLILRKSIKSNETQIKNYYAKKPHSHFSLSLLKVSLKRQRQSPFCGRIPHPCDLCGKVFRDARDLQRHNMVHTGEKPYSCSYCTTKFRQKAHLKRHLKDKHDRAEPTEAELRPNYD